ncbi:hypothetical protein BT96DRAFT_176759 [Gymnopus androsaceus JB14]|uniref:Ubiquitin-like protease family profile domain-containing protein n=1 Tax=Gymnopus androsaceus JB14 TaxID=1447944 RepID=A0A6A4IDA2_9AGAR|nr:hypothetical protein BT96DRAFT_176759 [Gymnopus androsaceus JB14]
MKAKSVVCVSFLSVAGITWDLQTKSIGPLVKTFRDSHWCLILYVFEKSLEKLSTRYPVSYNIVSSFMQEDIQYMKSLNSAQAASDDITMVDAYEAPNHFLLTSPSSQPLNINRGRDHPEEVLIRRLSDVHFPAKQTSEHDLTSTRACFSSLVTPPSSQFGIDACDSHTRYF